MSEIEKNLEIGIEREIGSEKNLMSGPMEGQEIGITKRIGTTETVTEPEIKRGKENVAAIVALIVHVIVKEVRTVPVVMIEIRIMDVLMIGIETGTVTMILLRQTMIVGIPVMEIMILITGKQNMIVEDMVKENEVMIMVPLTKIKGIMRLILGTSMKPSMMTIMDITGAEDPMMTKPL